MNNFLLLLFLLFINIHIILCTENRFLSSDDEDFNEINNESYYNYNLRHDIIKDFLYYELDGSSTYIDPKTLRPYRKAKPLPINKDSKHLTLLKNKLDILYNNIKDKKEEEKPITKEQEINILNNKTLQEALTYFNNNNYEKGNEILLKLIESKYPEALYQVGLYYQLGIHGYNMDFYKAFELFNQSASYGYPPAQRELAFMYDTGRGVSIDTEKALLYYTFAAKASDNFALLTLAHKYSNGINVSLSYSQSAVYYREVADKINENITKRIDDHSLYINIVDIKYYEETGSLPNENEDDIKAYIEFYAENGDPTYQTQLALMHIYGLFNTPIDYDYARYYLLQAHEQNFPRASAHLGFLYEEGYGVEQSNETAVKYYKIAAKQDSAHGNYYLGRAYLLGIGVDVNTSLAIKYLTKASDEFQVEAMVELGKIYFYGIDVPHDYKKAFGYFSSAANNGNTEGKYYYAKMNHYGLGTIENCENAIKYYKSVCRSGNWIFDFDKAFNEYLEGNYDRALILYEKLSTRGFVYGHSNTAWIYEKKLYSEELYPNINNKLKAFQSYKLASSQGYQSAHLKLGDYYYNKGQYNKQLYQLAIYHYNAISLTHGEALYNLAYMYQKGLGVNLDRIVANNLYIKTINIDSNSILASSLGLISLGYDYILSKYNDNKLYEIYPEFKEYYKEYSIWQQFLQTLQKDLIELEKELEKELQELENNDEYNSFLDSSTSLGYSIDNILITLLFLLITIIFLFRQGFIQVQVQRL